MPGVPLDAFSQVKKGLKSLYKKRRKSSKPQQEPNKPPTTTSQPLSNAPASTGPPPPVPQSQPSPVSPDPPKLNGITKADPIAVEMEGSEPAQAAHLPMDKTQTNNISPLKSNNPPPPSSTSPNLVLTPPSADRPFAKKIPASLDDGTTTPPLTGTHQHPSPGKPQMSATSGPLEDHPSFQ